MKTFDDLEFQPWGLDEGTQMLHPEAKIAKLNFPNGYGVSVILAPELDDFYSNGMGTYEAAVWKDGKLDHSLFKDVFAFQTKDQVNKLISTIQML